MATADLALESLEANGASGFQQLNPGAWGTKEEAAEPMCFRSWPLGVSLADALDHDIRLGLTRNLQGEDQGDVHECHCGRGGGDCQQAFRECGILFVAFPDGFHTGPVYKPAS